MMEQLSASTELEAVNAIIGSIGESPVDTLEKMTDVDAVLALRTLREVSRQEQARGWSFNIVKNFMLMPDAETHKIPWNDSYLFIKDISNQKKLVRQGQFIKDLYTQETVFDRPIEVEMVLYLPFEYLPEQMRNYIIKKATYVFQTRTFGDETLTKVTAQDIQVAWQYLQEYEIDNNDYSMLDITYVQQLLRR